MSDTTDGGPISLPTMRAWKSALEQLGAAGDLELLRQVAEQRQRQEAGDASNRLSPAQIGLIEGLTGITAAYDAPASAPVAPSADPASTAVDRPEQDVLALAPEDYQPTVPPGDRPPS